MAALTCDICGGNLTMNESGEFAICESCGMKHDKRRVKAKVQKISGVVEVTKGEAEIERLVKNAETFLSFNERKKAQDLFEQISEEYPDDYRGWLGLANIAKKKIEKRISKLNGNLEKIVLFKQYDLPLCEEDSNAREIIIQLSRLNYYYDKLILLDRDAASKISTYEKVFIETYKNSKLPYLNWLSVNVLIYNAKLSCSTIINKWSEEIILTFVNKFLSGEIEEIPWKVENPYEATTFCSIALNFLKKGYDNAQYLNGLTIEQQQNLLRSYGTKRPECAVKCVFWLKTTLIFLYNYGDGPEFRIQKSVVSLEQNETISSVINKKDEIEEKCKEALDLLPNITNCSLVLEEILANYSTVDLYRECVAYNTYDYEYRIISINANEMKYLSIYKDKYWGEKTKEIKVTFKEGTNFDEILSILKRNSFKPQNEQNIWKKNGRCAYCGGELKGVFKKFCSKCGKPKDY